MAGDDIQTGRREQDEDRAADLDAIRRTLGGERDAFALLVGRWQDRIHGAVLRMVRDAELARDLVQETFVRAYAHLAKFEGNSSFGTWLYAIALNQVRSEARRRKAAKRREPLSLDALRDADRGRDADPADPRAANPSDRIDAQERRAVLLDAVASLDEEFREALVLREFQGLAYEEIARIVGVPVGTVRSRLYRAREELREKLRGRIV